MNFSFDKFIASTKKLLNTIDDLPIDKYIASIILEKIFTVTPYNMTTRIDFHGFIIDVDNETKKLKRFVIQCNDVIENNIRSVGYTIIIGEHNIFVKHYYVVNDPSYRYCVEYVFHNNELQTASVHSITQDPSTNEITDINEPWWVSTTITSQALMCSERVYETRLFFDPNASAKQIVLTFEKNISLPNVKHIITLLDNVLPKINKCVELYNAFY